LSSSLGEKTMMISDLPHHLLEEILSRVPATTLKRLQPTCKQWNALLKDQIFTEKHHRKAPKQPLLLMLKEFRVCPVSVEINLSVTAPSIEFKDPFDIKGSPSSSQQVNIVEVIHCEGETKWIQASSHYKKKSSFALGYKNNKSCRDYKILRYWQSCKSEDQVVEFEIYELSSDSWRKDKDSSIFLLSFDFTTERFRRLNLPPVLPTMKLSLFREEQISGLHMNYFPLKMDLWVTTNFGTEAAALSWSKSFTVDLHVLEERYPMFTTFLLDEDKIHKKVVVCPGLVGRDTKNVVYIIGEDNEYHTEIPYVRSTQKPWWPPMNAADTKEKNETRKCDADSKKEATLSENYGRDQKSEKLRSIQMNDKITGMNHCFNTSHGDNPLLRLCNTSASISITQHGKQRTIRLTKPLISSPRPKRMLHIGPQSKQGHALLALPLALMPFQILLREPVLCYILHGMYQERENLFRYRDGVSESTIHSEIENPRCYRRDPAMAKKSFNTTVTVQDAEKTRKSNQRFAFWVHKEATMGMQSQGQPAAKHSSAVPARLRKRSEALSTLLTKAARGKGSINNRIEEDEDEDSSSYFRE
ncbi:hypothetical protein HID58_002753, partial [Brassica napus]